MRILIRPSDAPIASSAAHLLRAELRRYRDERIDGRRGRAVLVAGHRGAGKTYLVDHTLAAIAAEGLTPAGEPRRFLRIDLHGPTLLGGASRPAANPDAEKHAEGDDPTVRSALEQIVLSLYRSLVGEIAGRYRERVREKLHELPPSRRQEMLERAAQLELELDEYPGVDRLREFWHAGDFLTQGVLFPAAARTALPPDQGLRELVAVSTACEVFRRISGIFPTIKETQNRGAQHSEGMEAGAKGSGQELITPFLSLLAGGAVGTGLQVSGATGGLAVSAAGGLAAAFGTLTLFKYSAGRSRTHSHAREYTFVPDRSIATLDRALPALVRRLGQAGLVPVFVVDELDKVDCLPARMRDIVRHLKKFVSEQGFFCFLTDRSYFEYLNQRTASQVYPIEHTYFTDRLFVVFKPEALHRYVGGRLHLEPAAADGSPPSEQDTRVANSDLAALPYVILQRAEMHPIDLQREIGEIRGTDGEVDIAPGALRSEMGGRCDLMIQLAIRMLLHRKDLRVLMEREPEVTRLVYDTVYYPVRMRRQGRYALDLTNAGKVAFTEYVIGRMVPDRANQGDDHEVSLGASDAAFLFELLRDMATLLSDPYAYQNALATWESDTGTELDAGVRTALPLAQGTGPLLALVDHRRFRWGYDHLGRSVAEGNRSALAYQFDLEYRLAIEMMRQEKKKDLRADTLGGRMVEEILWLPWILWKNGSKTALPENPDLAELVTRHLSAEHAGSQALATARELFPRLKELLALRQWFDPANPAKLWANAYPLVVPSFRDHDPLLAADGPTHHWCYDFAGNPQRDGVKAPELAEEATWELQANFIPRVDEKVKELTKKSADLARLASLRIIGASPEWIAVQRALEGVETAGRFRRQPPGAQVDVLRAYTALLEQSGEAIALAVACACVVGTAARADPAGQITLGLEAIAALALDGTRPAVDVLRTLWAELAAYIRKPGAETSTPPTLGAPPTLGLTTLPAWGAWIEAVQRALSASPIPDPGIIRERTWELWRKRLESADTPLADFMANADELLCYVANTFPSTLLKPRLSTVSLEDWSTLLIGALATRTRDDVTFVPLWMVEPAASALGLGTQVEQVRKALPAHAGAGMPGIPATLRMPMIAHPAERTLLIIRQEGSATKWTSRWPAPAGALITTIPLLGELRERNRESARALLSGYGFVAFAAEEGELEARALIESLEVPLLSEAREVETSILQRAEQTDGPGSPLEKLMAAVTPPRRTASPYVQLAVANRSILPPRLAAFAAETTRSAEGTVRTQSMGGGLRGFVARSFLAILAPGSALQWVYVGETVEGDAEPKERFMATMGNVFDLRGTQFVSDRSLVHAGNQLRITFAVEVQAARVQLRQTHLATELRGLRGWWLRSSLGPSFEIDIEEIEKREGDPDRNHGPADAPVPGTHVEPVGEWQVGFRGAVKGVTFFKMEGVFTRLPGR